MTRPKEDNIYVKVASPILAAAGYARIGASWIKETGDGLACRVSIRMNMKTHLSYHIEIGVGLRDDNASGRRKTYSWFGATNLENIDEIPRKQRIALREALDTKPRPVVADPTGARQRALAIEAGIRKAGLSMLTAAQARRAIDGHFRREAIRAEVRAQAQQDRGAIVADAITRHAIPILRRAGTRQAVLAAYRKQLLTDEVSPVFGRYDARKAAAILFGSGLGPMAAIDLPGLEPRRARLTKRLLQGRKATLLHVWDPSSRASLAAHRLLKKIKASGLVRVYGISTDDRPEPARRFLRWHGNPYEVCAHDEGGAWRDGGAPRTLLLDRAGMILKALPALSDAQDEETLVFAIMCAQLGEPASRHG